MQRHPYRPESNRTCIASDKTECVDKVQVQHRWPVLRTRLSLEGQPSQSNDRMADNWRRNSCPVQLFQPSVFFFVFLRNAMLKLRRSTCLAPLTGHQSPADGILPKFYQEARINFSMRSPSRLDHLFHQIAPHRERVVRDQERHQEFLAV